MSKVQQNSLGIDFSTMKKMAMKPIKQNIKATQEKIDAKETSLSDLGNRVTALNKLQASLRTLQNVNTKKQVNGNLEYAEIIPDDNATVGGHNIKVIQPATTSRFTSQLMSNDCRYNVLLNMSVDNKDLEFNENNNTLAEVADGINAQFTQNALNFNARVYNHGADSALIIESKIPGNNNINIKDWCVLPSQDQGEGQEEVFYDAQQTLQDQGEGQEEIFYDPQQENIEYEYVFIMGQDALISIDGLELSSPSGKFDIKGLGVIKVDPSVPSVKKETLLQNFTIEEDYSIKEDAIINVAGALNELSQSSGSNYKLQNVIRQSYVDIGENGQHNYISLENLGITRNEVLSDDGNTANIWEVDVDQLSKFREQSPAEFNAVIDKLGDEVSKIANGIRTDVTEQRAKIETELADQKKKLQELDIKKDDEKTRWGAMALSIAFMEQQMSIFDQMLQSMMGN